MTRKIRIFIKKLNGSATFSEPKNRLTDAKIDKICNSVKLGKLQTVEKLLK